MGLISGYLLFALTTAICAYYELIFPVIMSIRKYSKTSVVIKQPIVANVTMFVLSFVFAPVMLIACLVPSVGSTFRDHLEHSLSEE